MVKRKIKVKAGPITLPTGIMVSPEQLAQSLALIVDPYEILNRRLVKVTEAANFLEFLEGTGMDSVRGFMLSLIEKAHMDDDEPCDIRAMAEKLSVMGKDIFDKHVKDKLNGCEFVLLCAGMFQFSIQHLKEHGSVPEYKGKDSGDRTGYA